MVRFSAIVLAVVMSATAFAQSDPLEALSDEEATRVLELLQVARDAEAAGRWLDAWAAYESVHDVVILPEVRLREARALEELGRFDAAADVYTELRAPGGHVATQAEELLQALGTNHPAVIEVHVVGTPAHVTLDGVDIGVVEGAASVRVLPGEHTIRVVAPEYEPVEYGVALGYGETDSRVFTFAALPRVAEPPARDERARGLGAPVGLGVASVAALAVGAGLIARRDGAASDARDEAETGITRGRYQSLRDRYDRSNIGAIAAFSAGAGLAAAALTTSLVRARRSDRDGARIGIGAVATGDGASGVCTIGW